MHKECLTQTSPTVSPSPPLSASHSPQSTIAMQYTHARTQTYRVASPNRYVTRQGKQTRWLVEKHRTINFSKRNERKDPENGIIKKQRLIHCNLAASCHVSLRFAGVRGASALSLSWGLFPALFFVRSLSLFGAQLVELSVCHCCCCCICRLLISDSLSLVLFPTLTLSHRPLDFVGRCLFLGTQAL